MALVHHDQVEKIPGDSLEYLVRFLGAGQRLIEAQVDFVGGIDLAVTHLGHGFAERFEVKRTQAREFFDELTTLAEKELKRSGEFVLPGMVKLVVQKRKARMGRNPATGEAIKIPAKTVVKARIAKQLKDTVLPKK